VNISAIALARLSADHQQLKRELARHAAGRDGEDRRAERDAERIAADEQPGGRHRYRQARRDLRQQAHDDEFGGADSKRGDRQCDEG
jgi:hypothetical protein